MKPLTIIICFLISNLLFSQEFKIKSIESPQYGSISNAKVKIKITDSLIIIREKKEGKEFSIQKIEKNGEKKQYTTKTKNNKSILFIWDDKLKSFHVKPEDKLDKNTLELTLYY